MKNSLVVALVVVTGSLVLFWNSRKDKAAPEVAAPAPVVQESAAQTPKSAKKKKESKTQEPVQAVLDVEKIKEVLPGYWASRSSVPYNNSDKRIQIYFSLIKNPELHDGKVIEGLIFTYDDKNPAMQSLGKLVFDKIDGQQVKFKLDKKDVSNYYADAYVNEEDGLKEITITPGEMLNVTAVNGYNERALAVGLSKLEVNGILANYKGKWRGVRKTDNEKVFLDFSKLKNFNDDFGDFKISGTCFTDSRFKIRPVDEKVVLISIGNASCGASTTVYKSIIGDSELETIAYRQYDEAYEMKFKKD